MVVLGWVDGELADELAGDGVGDAHVEVVDENDHAGAAVFGAEADVVHAPVHAQSDLAVVVDDVVADAVVAVVAIPFSVDSSNASGTYRTPGYLCWSSVCACGNGGMSGCSSDHRTGGVTWCCPPSSVV